MSPRWRRSLAARLAWPLVLLVPLVASLAAALVASDAGVGEAVAITSALGIPLLLWLLHRQLRPLNSLFRALSGVVESYRDGDFNFGLSWRDRDELGDLVAAHNRLADVMREQRLALTQRELLLDTMLQNTPVAMLLAREHGPVVYANLVARKLLNEGRKLEGQDLAALVARARPELSAALARGVDGVFAVGEGDEEDVFHLSRRKFRLNGLPHLLLMVRQLTHELRRQEVQTWKKVIRVMSHEMNNALGPIASLSRSGQELLRRGEPQRLGTILATIEERANHLDQFLRGYATFAKLPTPRLAEVRWGDLLAPLATQFGLSLDLDEPEAPIRLDAAQFTQALSNLVGNALDAGSPAAEIRLQVHRQPGGWRLDVVDRGSGMGEEVMARALTPFYSTKRTGTGLGLALAREIVEAHGGRIALANRPGGGLLVSLQLPGA